MNTTAILAFLSSINNCIAIHRALYNAVKTGYSQTVQNRHGEPLFTVRYHKHGGLWNPYYSGFSIYQGNKEITKTVIKALQA